MTPDVRIHEVGPRDGLQNEKRVIPLPEKLALISLLAKAGLTEIEVGSFVSPSRVPQMADSDALVTDLPASRDVRYTVLVPNMRGWDRFAAVMQPDTRYRVAVFISASEGFSRHNLNASVAESLKAIAPVIQAAQEVGVALRGYVSCVTDCPYDGPVAPAQVADVVAGLRDLAPMPISLGDTIGAGTPKTVAAMLQAVSEVAPVTALAGHFHDTGGRALANIDVSLDMGLRDFDSAAGGLGGCPYAPGAPGNVATEAVLKLMADRNMTTGVDAALVAEAGVMARKMR